VASDVRGGSHMGIIWRDQSEYLNFDLEGKVIFKDDGIDNTKQHVVKDKKK